MGTVATLVTYDSDRSRALKRLEAQLEILENVERELSTWRADTVLGRLNRQPVRIPFTLPPPTCRLFRDLAFWWHETGRAFDPAVGSLIEEWGIQTGGRVPSRTGIDAALRHAGLQAFSLNKDGCTVVRTASATIDSGAFGKGEALDRAYDAERNEPPESSWMIDLGGQVLVHGHPPESDGWLVPLAHPLERDRPVRTLKLVTGSLSTSGGSERDVRADGQRISHIVDPRTGYPAQYSGEVTAWHERALVADILSTALFVMGPEDGLQWAEDRGIAAVFLEPVPTDPVRFSQLRAGPQGTPTRLPRRAPRAAAARGSPRWGPRHPRALQTDASSVGSRRRVTDVRLHATSAFAKRFL